MSALGFPQAAGITGILTAAGLKSAEVHAWFCEPRAEIGGLTPAALVDLRESVPSAGRLLLELAKADARRLRSPMELELDDIDQAEADRREHAAEAREQAQLERHLEESDRRRSTMAAEPIRYAGLIYHAVRLAGRSPLVAAGKFVSVLRRELWCRMVGHDWSWTLAEMLGTKGRPVCQRCLRALPRKEAQRDA